MFSDLAFNVAYSATQSASALKLTNANYNYLMGQTGLFLGVLFCFFVLFAISNISKGN
jgi:hypothetical protein